MLSRILLIRLSPAEGPIRGTETLLSITPVVPWSSALLLPPRFRVDAGEAPISILIYLTLCPSY
jgi:hypothetical protein